MKLTEFVRRVSEFAALTHSEKIKHFGWWLHVHGGRDRFDDNAIRECYRLADLQPSTNLRQDLSRLEAKRPSELLRDPNGYRLEARVRDALDAAYGEHETTVVVSRLLTDLAGKVTDKAEGLFLSEAVTCYKHGAFRAAIVMTWNVAYDHLLSWILADANRLIDFNSAISKRYPGDKKKVGLVIVTRIDFEELKEFEVIEICGKAALFSDNLKKILNEKLTRRNIAAHPSLVAITRAQADDTITDLVNNVVLALT